MVNLRARAKCEYIYLIFKNEINIFLYQYDDIKKK